MSSVIAKYLVAFVGLYCFGGLVADAIVPATAKQHLWNPRWPPHAKFHNAQTMLLGILCGSITLAVLFGCTPLTKQLFLIAAAVASVYWISLVLSPLFPGTDWSDPEFQDETARPLGLSPQQLLSYCLLAVLIVALALGMSAEWPG
jgi:hypothetical protein